MTSVYRESQREIYHRSGDDSEIEKDVQTCNVRRDRSDAATKMPAASRSWKRRGTDCPLASSREHSPADTSVSDY